ncbi:MAG: class I SAM-dependent methyltransferase [Sediminibacterium sp.]|nr:class I SAM-dependent methyltransferase [Sediminibacterium sp.]
MTKDFKTAAAFSNSWNNLPQGSVYTMGQVEDWFYPLLSQDFIDKNILELGCGNGSLLVHIVNWKPQFVTGVDLGDSIKSCKENLSQTSFKNIAIIQHDLVTYRHEEKFDLVYCIGVLHHIKEPLKGLRSVIENTKPGGKFHCWVYAQEGNAVIRYIVDPIRKIASKLPWWFNKYFIATPLAFLYYLYAHFIVSLHISFAPLYDYSKWICKRNFLFFRHVAFDQLVTPQTIYVSKKMITDWITQFSQIDPNSVYIIFRNGNSWKFGGSLKS